MQKKILLICFDTPFPTNYGGVFDIEAKFKFFQKNNTKVDLICTCFDKKRGLYFQNYLNENQTVIDNFHIEFIQPGIQNFTQVFHKKPFSAIVRKINYSKIGFLKNNDYEFVLVEHLKSTYKIEKLRNILKLRNPNLKFLLRIHNDEEIYYKNLYKTASTAKKYFFYSESIKYKNYQKEILRNSNFDEFLFISKAEMENLKPLVSPTKKVEFLPVYFDQNDLKPGSKNEFRNIDFLYVGNLDLEDNFKALKEIKSFLFSQNFTDKKINIAGKCSSEKRKEGLFTLFSELENFEISFNVEKPELEKLYTRSKFFLNFSANSGGVKTKMIHALNYGVPVISNPDGVEGSGFEDLTLKTKDAGWIKNALENAEIWKNYHSDFLNQLKLKMDWAEEKYNQVFSQYFNDESD